jgi:hypothetical protein
MRPDALIKKDGFEAIFEKLDIVEAERFIALLKRENFDYTKWRKNLWENMTVEELAIKAMNYYITKDTNN